MKHTSIIVRADWDEEAKVWVATSTDIDGLALESATLETLFARIPEALCDLLELNESYAGMPSDIPYHVMASQTGSIPNPCH